MLSKGRQRQDLHCLSQAVTALYASAERESKKSRMQSRQLLVNFLCSHTGPSEDLSSFVLQIQETEISFCRRSANFSGF